MPGDAPDNPLIAVERTAQADLLRDIFGPLPFHTVALNPDWFDWNDSTIMKLAQPIYDDRAFDRLPILADALEEAGCDNAELLSHLRGPGPHVRGCWALDHILGRS
jgi:hypothetical protein